MLGEVQPGSQGNVWHRFSFAVTTLLHHIRQNSPGYGVLKQCETHLIPSLTKYKNRCSSASRALFPSVDRGEI